MGELTLLREALINAWLAGFAYSSEGWNGEHPMGDRVKAATEKHAAEYAVVAITAWNTRPRTEGRGEGVIQDSQTTEPVASDKALFDALWDLVAAMANEGIPQTPRTKAAFKVAHQAALDRLRKDWSSPIREPEISREALIKLLADHFGFRPYEQMAEDKSDLRGKIRDGYDYDINEPTRSHLSETADAILNLAPVGGRGEGWRPTHRHVKRGTTYQVVTKAAELQIATAAPLEGHHLVIYRDEAGKTWARAAFEFYDGRFEPLPPPPQEQKGGSSQSQPGVSAVQQPASSSAQHSAEWRCRRCGRDEVDCRENGCPRGPCPMELVG